MHHFALRRAKAVKTALAHRLSVSIDHKYKFARESLAPRAN